MSLNDTPNEPSQTQADDDNSFVCPLPRLNDFQCRPLLTSCAIAHFENGLVETDIREPMSLRSFCRGAAVWSFQQSHFVLSDKFIQNIC